mgnify:CR=1 FL=1
MSRTIRWMMKRMVHCIRNKYKKLAHKEQKVIFGRRLGEYKYYDMDAVIASALELAEKEVA